MFRKDFLLSEVRDDKQSVRGYIRGNPVAILMAYVLGLVLLLCLLVPGYGFCFVLDGVDPLLWFRCGIFRADSCHGGVNS